MAQPMGPEGSLISESKIRARTRGPPLHRSTAAGPALQVQTFHLTNVPARFMCSFLKQGFTNFITDSSVKKKKKESSIYYNYFCWICKMGGFEERQKHEGELPGPLKAKWWGKIHKTKCINQKVHTGN